MADRHTPAQRSYNMSRIRSTGTKPEQRLVSIIQTVAGRRKVHLQAKVKGIRVDAFIPSLKLAIFCDGCFYHCCPKHGHVPKSNIGYWKPKLERNARRDRRYRSLLRRNGFRVWKIWEHDLGSRDEQRIQRTLNLRLSQLLKRSACPSI
jgi:DNA mismatch endonuclease, patch repair protein